MLGVQITDLFLAEKNVVDFVDKNLGQEWDRLKQNELEMDYVCSRLVGGSLDYPPMISHDFCDIISAWDVYVEALTRELKKQLPMKFAYGVFLRPEFKNERLSKMPFRGDELTANQFINSVISCCPKILDHLEACAEEAMSSGRIENLYVIVSNTVIIRNYLWLFHNLLEADVAKPRLRPEYDKFCDYVDAVSEQMLLYQLNLLTTYVTLDENSPKWTSNTPYFEGEKGSPTVQMWAYFLKSMQRDMWKIMPPALSQRILGMILSRSLAILVPRYSHLSPSDALVPQYCSDIINILSVVREFLYFIGNDLESVLNLKDQSNNRNIFSIHAKCKCLAHSLFVIGSPLELLFKSLRRGLTAVPFMEQKKIDGLCEPPWISMLNTLCWRLEPSFMYDEDWELYYCFKMLSSQPNPSWPLIYKVITMHECKLSEFIFMLFPCIRAPAMIDFLLEGQGFKRCGHASCMDYDCHSLSKAMPNHLVVSCLLYIIGQTLPSKSFAHLFKSILPVITDWKEMDKTEIWNRGNRQIWFQSIVDILLPNLKYCVQSLLVGMDEENELSEDLRASTSPSPTAGERTSPSPGVKRKSLLVSIEGEDDATMRVIELLNAVTEIVSIIPRGFFLLCEEIDNWIPPGIVPVRNMAVVHFIVCGLYMLLHLGQGIVESVVRPKLKEEHSEVAGEGNDQQQIIQKNKNDYEESLLAVAERLCHLDEPIFDQAVHRLVTQIESMIKQSSPPNPDDEDTEDAFTNDYAYEWDRCQVKADCVLWEEEGQLAFKVVYWFLITHSDVLEKAIMEGMLSKKKARPSNLKIAPSIRTSFKTTNVIHDFHYVNKFRTFDQVLWKKDKLDWVQTVRNCKMGIDKCVLANLLEKRWEFQSEANISLNLKKMVDEMKALIIN